MSETSIPYMQERRKNILSWVPGVIFRPTQTFTLIVNHRGGNWFAPLLVLSAAILLNIFAKGYLNQQAALMGNVPLPPDFQYWMPQQQEQYLLSQQVRQGPVFHYVIPGIFAVSAAWVGWMLVGGMTHLAMTLFGGRGETGISMNLVAWASLPLALRELVRAVYHLGTQQVIHYAGLSGFVASAGAGSGAFLGELLALVDLYLVWHILLLVLGARMYTGIRRAKAVAGVLIVIAIILLAQTSLSYLVNQVSQLSIARPYFF